MPLYFVTGNRGKFEEVRELIPEIEQLDLDLPELQEINAREIITHKLLEAFSRHPGEFIVEDTGLCLDCLNGLPGPLIKWFLAALGNDGLVRITESLGNNRATARTLIGYARSHQEIYFFEGTLAGRIVPPRGSSGFGWDAIFQPDGRAKTFAEMSREEKNAISMRRLAADQLQKFMER
jgi:non-canonical purine NTP pyrophosphatase (RdgB/HAM1 family)